jgi:hypothetical protein
MRDFIRSRRFVTGMTMHAYSEINLLPYGWAEVRHADAAAYEEIGYELKKLTGYPHGQPWELLYFSNGRAQDWQVHDARMVVIEPEIGSAADGFWPPARRIQPLAERNLQAILYMAQIAGAHLAPSAIEVRDGIPYASAAGALGNGNGRADPGETVEVVLLLRNQGWADLDGVRMTPSSRSPVLTVPSSPIEVGFLPARTTRRMDRHPIQVAVAADAAPGETAVIALDFSGARGYVGSATVELVPGTPTLVFVDDGESGLSRWSTTQGWGITELPSGLAFTDSPRGDYQANANNALVLDSPIDLSGARRAVLSYREMVATEPWDDLCHVEASVPGENWLPLAVLPGGVDESFRERRLSLDALAGEPRVRLRFRLTSNQNNQQDGWTIDDIAVWAYPGPDSSAAVARAGTTQTGLPAIANPHPGSTTAE